MRKNKEANWFKELKKIRRKFENVENVIEFFKFRYDKDLQLPQWMLGIGIAFLLSANLSGIFRIENIFLRKVGIFAYIISLIFFLIGTILLVLNVYRQKKAMFYLYKERDKQNSKTKNDS